ncbi:uncharacterized protein LOC143027776 [Oratosquilla oratoria]|uniref:uncharacterized protein LOC143027776 n=1 Tax=Oratosquilla oratoria TaxID=337810 RepID=UPI003F7712A9
MKLDSACFVFLVGLLRLVTMAASASVLATTEPTTEEWAWQSNLTTVHERLQYLYKSGQYSDLSISFPDYQENVTVHKLVLAMSSPVFGSMFMGILRGRQRIIST